MKSRILIFVACLATAGFGCSGDDNNQNDGGPDGSQPDVKNDVVGTDGGGDAGDGGCNFATFVINMINTETSNTSTPSTDLGQNCVDNQNQAEFKTLFP